MRSYIEADGTEWLCVRDFVKENGFYLRPNGTPDTNRFLDRLPAGEKVYKPLLEKGRWIVLAYAPTQTLMDTAFPVKTVPEKKKPVVKEMTLVDFYKLTRPDAPPLKRSAMLGLDRDLQQIFWATHGKDKPLRGSGGLTFFPTSFLEEHEIAAD